MKIVVLAGGISTERAVSLVTGTGVCRALRENGAVTALMTGSGAAVFGVFHTEEEALAAAAALRPRWPEVYTARPVRGGAEVQPVRRR